MTRTWWLAATALIAIAHCEHQALASSTLVSPTQTGETGLVYLPTTQVLAPWKISFSVSENGELGDSTPGSAIELWRTQFSLGVGLLPNLEFTTFLPYIQFERDVPSNRHTDDIGGWRLGLKYRLVDEDEGALASVALLGAMVLGTGRDSFPAILDRNSAWGARETYEVMGILDKRLWTTTTGADAVLTVDAGGLFFDKPASFAVRNQTLQFQRRFEGPDATFDNPFEFGVGLQLPVMRVRDVSMDFLSEFRGNTGIIEQVHGALPTWLFTGARLQASNGLAIQGGPDFGLSGYLEPYRFVVGLSYAMPSARARLVPPPPPLPPVGAVAAAPGARKKIVLRGVRFDPNESIINAEARPVLQAAADILRENPGIRIVIAGHTDSKGTAQYNQRLSLRRATAVRNYLETLGVPANRMSIQAKGAQQPAASNATEEGRAENRRVDLLVQP